MKIKGLILSILFTTIYIYIMVVFFDEPIDFNIAYIIGTIYVFSIIPAFLYAFQLFKEKYELHGKDCFELNLYLFFWIFLIILISPYLMSKFFIQKNLNS